MREATRKEVGTVEACDDCLGLIGSDNAGSDQAGSHSRNAQAVELAHWSAVLDDVKLSVRADVLKAKPVNLPDHRSAL
jgi:hypothetical protein